MQNKIKRKSEEYWANPHGYTSIKLNPESFESIPMGDIIYWTIRILIVFPIYQVILIIIGALFFQFSFFWNFEKKILKRIGFKRFFKDY